MKNNKMKKIISMMVAILVVFSALTVHAAAEFYEFDGNNSECFGGNFDGSHAYASGSGTSGISCSTDTYEDDAIYISVDATFVYNVDNGTPLYVFKCVGEEELNNFHRAGSVPVNSDEIPTDYTIYSYTSCHYVESETDSATIYIGMSY